MKAWLQAHWRQLAIGALSLLGLLLAAGLLSRLFPKLPKGVTDLIDHHREVLSARDEALALRSQLGVELAEQAVRERYAKDVARLDAQERARIEALRGDPERLAEAAIVAIARHRRRR